MLDGGFKLLSAPVSGAMIRNIHESLSCRVYYHLCKGDEVILDFISDRASFENEY